MFIIRRFTKEDALDCCKIAINSWVNNLSNYYPDKIVKQFISKYTEKKFINSSINNDIFVLKNTLTEEIIGFVTIKVNKQTILIKRLFIKNSFRRKGIGSKIIRFLKKHYHKTIIVESAKSKQAINFYKKNNFIKIKSTINGLIMELKYEYLPKSNK